MGPGVLVSVVVRCAEGEGDLFGGAQQPVYQGGLVVGEGETAKRRAGKLEKELSQITLVVHVLKPDVQASEKRGFHGVRLGVDGVEQLPRQRPELLTGMVHDFHGAMLAVAG